MKSEQMWLSSAGWHQNGPMRYAWRRSLRPLLADGSESQPSGLGPDSDEQLRLDEMRDVPVVVVLGERGAGKSVALEQEHEVLISEGAETAALLHLGRDVFDAMTASSTLRSHMNVEGDDARYVLLDGLDEGLSDIPRLDNILLFELRNMDSRKRERLRLRITCRTTRWPEELERGLRGLWPDPGQVALTTLAPLTSQDVHNAATQHGLNGALFAGEVALRDLGPLAQQPVTLIPLLEAQQKGEELPRTVADAYVQACRTLCTENQSRGFDQRKERPAVDHLLEVARWVAAALQFTRSAAIVDREQTLHGELHLDSLSGSGIPGLVPELPCRRHELMYLTESGLLTPVSQRRWVFAHRSYQEHLAAEYLHSCVAPEVRRELLWVGSGPARHVPPEHEEIAARLAMHDADLFDDLLVHHPVVVLLADLPTLSAPHRQRAVEALLRATPHENFERLDFNLLERLDHPGLDEQLKPFLTRDADPDQMYLALWIAHQCQTAGLTLDLLSVAEDTTMPLRFRSFAFRAMAEEEEPSEQTVARLRRLAFGAEPSIVDSALGRLWPHHLQLTEYFDLLPVQTLETHGQALEIRMTAVNSRDIDEALNWSVKTLDARSPKAPIAVALLARCIRLEGKQTTDSQASRVERAGQALVALAAYPELSHMIESRAAFESLHDSLNVAPLLRRRLADYVLRHSSQDHVLELIFASHEVGLFPDEDLLHWAGLWPDLPQEVQHTAQPLISRRPRPNDELLREAVDRARQADEELRQATAWWDAPTPEWQQRRQQREEERRRRNTFDQEQFITVLQAVQAAKPEDVRGAWLTALGHLYRTSDGRRVEQPSALGAVAAAPSCPPEDGALYEKLTAAAMRVLVTAPAWSSHDVAAWGTHWSDVPELLAAAFVPVGVWEAAVSETDVGRWAGWALALATMTPIAKEQSLHRSLFERCIRHAGSAFEAALTACLDRLDSYRLSELTRSLHALRAASALDVVRSWAALPGRSSESWAAVVVTLTHIGDDAALTQVKDVVATGPADMEATPERWITAVQTVMSFDTLPESWPHVRRAFSDPALCRAVIDRVASEPGRLRSWPAGVAALDEGDLSDLYMRLCEREELRQPRPEHEPGVAYRITPAETLHDLADGLPQLIADKGTQQAADCLSRLAASASRDSAWLQRLARHSSRQAALQQLRPVEAHQLRRLAADHSLRVITDEVQLLDVVIEALDRVQQTLSGPNGMAILLWNRTASGDSRSMWPTWEDDFSDLVMGLLKIHLGGRRIILNREVQVDRPGAGGGRTDIHIQAADPSQNTEPFTVVIECKGCWNRELSTALDEQLVARYLRKPRTAGILLVGFFDCNLWDPQHRPRCSPSHTRRQLEHDQRELAAQHHDTVRARVLDCRPPGAQID